MPQSEQLQDPFLGRVPPVKKQTMRAAQHYVGIYTTRGTLIDTQCFVLNHLLCLYMLSSFHGAHREVATSAVHPIIRPIVIAIFRRVAKALARFLCPLLPLENTQTHRLEGRK